MSGESKKSVETEGARIARPEEAPEEPELLGEGPVPPEGERELRDATQGGQAEFVTPAGAIRPSEEGARMPSGSETAEEGESDARQRSGLGG